MQTSTIDWDDPAARAALIERIGVEQYERRFAEHRAQSVIETCHGHDLRFANTRFGRLVTVGSTGRAFSTIEQARTFAAAGARVVSAA